MPRHAQFATIAPLDDPGRDLGTGRRDDPPRALFAPGKPGLREPAQRSAIALLSEREHEIAELVARGWSNKEIARHLAISHYTVSTHLRRVFVKLDINRRIELCLLLAARG